jgi:hypothetical protein
MKCDTGVLLDFFMPKNLDLFFHQFKKDQLLWYIDILFTGIRWCGEKKHFFDSIKL